MKEYIKNNIVNQIQSFKDNKDLTMEKKRKRVEEFSNIIIL